MYIQTEDGKDIYALPSCATCTYADEYVVCMDACPICNFDDKGDICVPELCEHYSEGVKE